MNKLVHQTHTTTETLYKLALSCSAVYKYLMIEYLRCIYLSWASTHSCEYAKNNYDEYVTLASKMMHYTEQEVRLATEHELWIKH